ncbi:MAG: sensor histidine kinase [Synergistales bacterium]|nr:sensor histidine kinase [Synergistales bacterium]
MKNGTGGAMRQTRRPLGLKAKIVLFTLAVFLVSLVVVGIVAESVLVEPHIERLGEEALNLARSVASIPVVRRNVGRPGAEAVIQPVADGIRKRTGVRFVVVIDRQSVRYSHPVSERIGRTFVGGDEGPALEGKEYVSRSVGTLGPSMRAFVPILREGKVVGAVSVGILMDSIVAMRRSLNRNLLVALALGLGVSACGAAFLADNIKRDTRGLEPYQIALLLSEREAVLNSVRDGIITVDEQSRITHLNSKAKEMLELDDAAIGQPVERFLPSTKLPEVVATGEQQLDREQRIGALHILTNRFPLKGDGRVVGAIASFRDMTEVQSLAEELTGVRRFVEALRVQNHEFLNKLHAISGMLQLGERERAVEYISGAIETQQSQMTFITRRIKNPGVGGLLLGKSGRCKELGVDFHIAPDSWLAERSEIDTNALVVVLGNLLENAMSAVLESGRPERTVECGIFDESGKIILYVRDNGVGIPEGCIPRIFEKGFTTHGSGGYGLYHVKALVETYRGEISCSSSGSDPA